MSKVGFQLNVGLMRHLTDVTFIINTDTSVGRPVFEHHLLIGWRCFIIEWTARRLWWRVWRRKFSFIRWNIDANINTIVPANVAACILTSSTIARIFCLTSIWTSAYSQLLIYYYYYCYYYYNLFRPPAGSTQAWKLIKLGCLLRKLNCPSTCLGKQ